MAEEHKSHSDRIKEQHEILKEEQVKLQELMSPEVMTKNENLIYQQREVVDVELKKYNAMLSNANSERAQDKIANPIIGEQAHINAFNDFVDNAKELNKLYKSQNAYNELQQKAEDIAPDDLKLINERILLMDRIRFSLNYINNLEDENTKLLNEKDSLGFIGRRNKLESLEEKIAYNNTEIINYQTYTVGAVQDLVGYDNNLKIVAKLDEFDIKELQEYHNEVMSKVDVNGIDNYPYIEPTVFLSETLDERERLGFENKMHQVKEELETLLRTYPDDLEKLRDGDIDAKIDELKTQMINNLDMISDSEVEQLYGSVMEIDDEGWIELDATKKLTGIDEQSFLSSYAYEDSKGYFEKMEGKEFVQYYERMKFGDWIHEGYESEAYETGRYIIDDNNAEYKKYLEDKKLEMCKQALNRRPEDYVELVDNEKFQTTIKDVIADTPISSDEIKMQEDELIQRVLDDGIDKDKIHNSEEMNEKILKKVLSTYPYQITVSKYGDSITLYDEDPLVGEGFNSFDKALETKIESLSASNNLYRSLQMANLTIDEQEYLKSQYAVDVNERIFVDMDGVLAQFDKTIESEEVLFEKGYYADLQPQERVVEGIKNLVHDRSGNVYILSAAVDSPYSRPEKLEWLKEHLPELKEENIILTKNGHNKVDFVPEGVKSTDYLIDDHNKNLQHWKDAGGKPIKLVNPINDEHKTWDGHRLHHQDRELAYTIDRTLKNMKLGLNPEELKYGTFDITLDYVSNTPREVEKVIMELSDRLSNIDHDDLVPDVNLSLRIDGKEILVREVIPKDELLENKSIFTDAGAKSILGLAKTRLAMHLSNTTNLDESVEKYHALKAFEDKYDESINQEQVQEQTQVIEESVAIKV